MSLKVGDFGLSRIKRNTLVTGGVRGTLPWMAPELLNGSSSRVSEKVRIYLLLALHAIKSIKNANDLINKISNIFFGGFDRSMFFHLVLRCGRY